MKVHHTSMMSVSVVEGNDLNLPLTKISAKRKLRSVSFESDLSIAHEESHA
jgi:hypothetical protein